MAKTKKTEYDFSSEKILTKALEEVMHDSMLPYSEFVIMDRALPRVEDGLKPVQRRVLYSMWELGVFPDREYKKSARIVGDCMGKYHPHGDSSIYGTLVRLAQDFNMGEVLIDGHGNFGSVDGDGAAAMRYTEAKLAPIALEMLRDIEKNTVSWSFNFDDSCKEPDMLPGRFPNLLVNGGSGIAVGLATNIPTHNLTEVCELVGAYIDNRKMSLDDMLKIMPGPDFHTGGYIMKNSEIQKLYETGKGKIVLRAKLHVELAENGKKNIVITEIPYQVNKSQLLQRIAKLKETDETGLLSYISEIVDESDRSGLRAVIKLKKDAKVNAILKYLYKNSDLECNFNANMVAIADGKPKQLALREILEYYVNYQQGIIYNRTKYDLEVALKKEHILEGLMIAINNIDEVVRIIKTSKNTTEAKLTLMSTFSLTDVQSQAILDMRLARLTNLEVEKLTTELNRLKDLIKRYTEILKNPKMQLKIVKKECIEIGKTYGHERLSVFHDVDDEVDEIEDNVQAEQVEELRVIYSPFNTIKTVNNKSFNLATKELSASGATLYEIPMLSVLTDSTKQVYGFTNTGCSVKLDVKKINQTKFKDKGVFINALCNSLHPDEKFVSLIELSDKNKDESLVFVTKNGLIKVTKIEEYLVSKQNISAIKLKENDEVIYVSIIQSSTKLALFTRDGNGMVTDISDVQPSGRVGIGIKGIALGDGDEVINAIQVRDSDNFMLFMSSGTAKMMKYSEVPELVRNRKGYKVVKGDNKLLLADVFLENVNYVIETKDKELSTVENKSLTLLKRADEGKKLKHSNIVKVYRYDAR